jgi:hypothetical protein
VRRSHTPLELSLCFAALSFAAVVVVLIMEGRVASYRARNEAGECAHCRIGLDDRTVRRIAYRLSKTEPATDIAVCPPCFERHRGRRVMFWSLFLSGAAMLFWWLRR